MSDSGLRYHMVAKDETLSGIAREYGVGVQDLARMNGIEKPYELKEGSRLIIPKTQNLVQLKEDDGSKDESEKIGERSDSKLAWPICGKIIKKFGTGDKLRKNGITLEGDSGAKVRAAESGKVGHAGEIPGLGKVVLIDHSERLVSVYAYLNEISVAEGDHVARNQVIGYLSNSANNKKPSLYFEVRSHAKPVNPLKFLSSKP
ncbi:MAG: peptidoglycan DD-metalloendopeptidase family protein [Desulfomonilaceae bacterium]